MDITRRDFIGTASLAAAACAAGCATRKAASGLRATTHGSASITG